MTAIFQALWQWLIRWGVGFLPISGQQIGKILWVIGIVCGCLFAYHKITQPTSNTSQRASSGGTIINHNYAAPKATFGCANLRVLEAKEKDK